MEQKTFDELKFDLMALSCFVWISFVSQPTPSLSFKFGFWFLILTSHVDLLLEKKHNGLKKIILHVFSHVPYNYFLLDLRKVGELIQKVTLRNTKFYFLFCSLIWFHQKL